MQKKVYRYTKIVCFAEKKLFFVGNVRKKQLFSAFRYNYLKRVLHNRSVYVIMQMKIENIEEGNTDVEGAPDMLKAEQVAKVFQTKYERVDAIRSFSYEFPERGMAFVLGKSGCGKSTLLSLLGGLDVPTSGKIYFDGKDLSEFTQAELEQYRSQSVGMIFQSGNLFSDLNVHENIFFSAGARTKRCLCWNVWK